MERWVSRLKALIQGVASVIFVLQMIYAVQKYYSQPIVTSMGSKSLEDVANPVIVLTDLVRHDVDEPSIQLYKKNRRIANCPQEMQHRNSD